MKTPRMSGVALATMARVTRSRAGQTVLRGIVRGELKVGMLGALPDALRGDVPLDTRPLAARPARAFDDLRLGLPPERAWSGTSDAFSRAYRSGQTTPRDVVGRALDAARALAARTPAANPMLDMALASAVEEADASTARWRAGRPLSPLDGVPFAVKEQTGVRGLPRRSGAPYGDPAPRADDATVVARLRALGAIPIGTTVMTEHGLTPFGCNPHRAMPRNPHDPRHVAGGSSTGSGVAVATGLVPFALGADGGGSIRIPAALNGIFGIKPTWGKMSRYGDRASDSVSHLGPLASSTLDLARVLDAAGAPDPQDRQTDGAPVLAPGTLERAVGRGVRGLRVGIEEREWRDASRGVAKACEEAVRALEREGATIVDVQIPLARFAPAIGYVVIGMEVRAALRADFRDHGEEMGHDLQITLNAVGTLAATEYVDALRLRSGLRRQAQAAFADVDLLALPTTVATATTATDAEMSAFVDPTTLDELCRFNFFANLTGLPALSAPIGKDAQGMPIGFQLVGDAWDEASVLAASAHLERIGAARTDRPAVAVEVLKTS